MVIIHSKLHTQTGQAVTEFNVTAAFLLVPLFILIPFIGKHIDMKHSSVQAARYMAWERTVWFEQSTVPEGTSTANVKSQKQLEKEVQLRFFTGLAFDESLAGTERNSLWNDRGKAMVDSLDDISAEFTNKGNEDVLNSKGNQSIHYKFMEKSSMLVGNAASLMGNAIYYAVKGFNTGLKKIISSAPTLPLPKKPYQVDDLFQFKGYYRPAVTVNTVNKHYQRVFESKEDYSIKSQSALLTDSWVVEGGEQFADWTDAFVPFSALRDPFKVVKTVFTWKVPVIGISLAPELEKLKLGYVDTDPVTDSSVRLKKEDCPGGLCSYED